MVTIKSHPVLLRGSALGAKTLEDDSIGEDKQDGADWMAALMGVALPSLTAAKYKPLNNACVATSPTEQPLLSPSDEDDQHPSLLSPLTPPTSAPSVQLSALLPSPTFLLLNASPHARPPRSSSPPLAGSPSSSCYSRPSAPPSGEGGDFGLARDVPPMSASFVVVQSLTPFLVWTPAPGSARYQQQDGSAKMSSFDAEARIGALRSPVVQRPPTRKVPMSPLRLNTPTSASAHSGIDTLLSPANTRKPDRKVPMSPLRLQLNAHSAAPYDRQMAPRTPLSAAPKDRQMPLQTPRTPKTPRSAAPLMNKRRGALAALREENEEVKVQKKEEVLPSFNVSEAPMFEPRADGSASNESISLTFFSCEDLE